MTTKTDEQELLPCSFCGKAVYFERHGTHMQSFIVACESCGCSLETGKTGYARAALQSQPKANDLMLSGVLRMPFDMAMADELSRVQFYQRAQQALNELEVLQSQHREDALVQAIQEAIALLGPEAPSCSGCEYEWNHALRVLHEAIDHARRIEGES